MHAIQQAGPCIFFLDVSLLLIVPDPSSGTPCTPPLRYGANPDATQRQYKQHPDITSNLIETAAAPTPEAIQAAQAAARGQMMSMAEQVSPAACL